MDAEYSAVAPEALADLRFGPVFHVASRVPAEYLVRARAQPTTYVARDLNRSLMEIHVGHAAMKLSQRREARGPIGIAPRRAMGDLWREL